MHDMHVEMRGMRGEMREMRVDMRAMRADMHEMRDEMREMRVELREDRRRSDERFERVIREFREDSARRDRAIVKVGVSILKTLSSHTAILQRIDRKLGVRGNGGRGRNGPPV